MNKEFNLRLVFRVMGSLALLEGVVYYLFALFHYFMARVMPIIFYWLQPLVLPLLASLY